jgi:CRP-like cAMP-binding protein
MPASSPAPTQNLILAGLPSADYERLEPHLEFVELPLGRSLYESGGQQNYAYFPTEGIVSLLYVTAGGNSAELAVIGREGMIGVSVFMGGETTPNRAVVQAACKAYRLPVQVLKDQFARGGPLQIVLLRYTQALITQISQTAVCNLHHSVDQQLCRWLLLSLDRLSGARCR